MRLLLICLTLFFVSGCFQSGTSWDLSFEQGEVESTDKTVQIPKSLAKKLEDIYLKDMRNQLPEDPRTESQLLLEVPRKFFDMKVLTREANEGVLKAPTQFSFPRGGGEVDLASILTDRRGAFYMKVELLLAGQAVGSNLRVFFVPRAKSRRLGDQVLGDSCGHIFEVSNFFKDHVLSGTQKIYTADARHLGLLVGTFVFLQVKEGELYLSSLTFKDSRFPELQCSI